MPDITDDTVLVSLPVQVAVETVFQLHSGHAGRNSILAPGWTRSDAIRYVVEALSCASDRICDVRENLDRGDWARALLVIASAGFYGPIRFWGDNAWDLMAPQRVLAVGFILTLVGTGLLYGFVAVGGRPIASSVPISAGIIGFMNWHRLGAFIWILVLVAAGLVAIALHRPRRVRFERLLAAALVAALGVAPLVSLHRRPLHAGAALSIG